VLLAHITMYFLINCIAAQIYGLLTLPRWVVAAALGFHLCLVYSSLQREGTQPPLPWSLVWFFVQSAAPFLLYSYMRKVAVRRRAKGCEQAHQSSSWQGNQSTDETCNGNGVKGHQEDAAVKPCDAEVTDTQMNTVQNMEQEFADSLVSTTESIYEQPPRYTPAHELTQQQQLQLQRALAVPHDSSKCSLQSLANAQRLLLLAGAGRTYKSRLAQSQVHRQPCCVCPVHAHCLACCCISTVLGEDPKAFPVPLPYWQAVWRLIKPRCVYVPLPAGRYQSQRHPSRAPGT
jgi:hypothetical protein